MVAGNRFCRYAARSSLLSRLRCALRAKRGAARETTTPLPASVRPAACHARTLIMRRGNWPAWAAAICVLLCLGARFLIGFRGRPWSAL
jgi:hypothetical protein